MWRRWDGSGSARAARDCTFWGAVRRRGSHGRRAIRWTDRNHETEHSRGRAGGYRCQRQRVRRRRGDDRQWPVGIGGAKWPSGSSCRCRVSSAPSISFMDCQRADGILGQAAQDDLFEQRRNLGRRFINRPDIVAQDGRERGDAGSPLEGALAGQHLVEHANRRRRCRSARPRACLRPARATCS